MPPKKVPKVNDERVKRVRSVAKQLNEQELVHELNEAISSEVHLPAGRSRSPSISDGSSRSRSPASVNSRRLKVRRNRIQSPVESPYSSRSTTPVNSSPRMRSPTPEVDPKPTNRVRRGLRLVSISEKEIPPRRAVGPKRKESVKPAGTRGGERNENKQAGQTASNAIPKDDRSHGPHGVPSQTKRGNVPPKQASQITPGASKKNARKQSNQPSASGLDKAKQIRNDHARKQTSQSTSSLHPHVIQIATDQNELDDDAFSQVSLENRVSTQATYSASGSVQRDKGRKRHDRDTLGQGTPEALEQVNDRNSSIHNETANTSSVDTSAKLEAENRRLKETIRRLETKISVIEKEKVEAVNHALKLSIELQDLREGRDDGEGLEFTEVEDVPATKDEMEQLSARSLSDSMFVGLLLLLIIGPERLIKMSASGQPSRRYAKKRNADGSLVYPATEAVKPHIIDFLCDKVAQRNQMLLGYRNIAKIRHASTEKKIKGYITNKIGNLKKAEHERRLAEANPR